MFLMAEQILWKLAFFMPEHHSAVLHTCLNYHGSLELFFAPERHLLAAAIKACDSSHTQQILQAGVMFIHTWSAAQIAQ